MGAKKTVSNYDHTVYQLTISSAPQACHKEDDVAPKHSKKILLQRKNIFMWRNDTFREPTVYFTSKN